MDVNKSNCLPRVVALAIYARFEPGSSHPASRAFFVRNTLTCLEPTRDKHQRFALQPIAPGRDGRFHTAVSGRGTVASRQLGRMPGEDSPVVNRVGEAADVPYTARQLGDRPRPSVHLVRTPTTKSRALVTSYTPVTKRCSHTASFVRYGWAVYGLTSSASARTPRSDRSMYSR